MALSTAMRYLLPLHRLIHDVVQTMGLSEDAKMKIKTTVLEDNERCLKLAKLEPPRLTPR